ncbi:hypothetical protein [Salipiger sp.]|uniref:hypothetical protein n=1 Tax=Salipiger sp. TaxID=2078585 RepID=UPI003A9790A0
MTRIAMIGAVALLTACGSAEEGAPPLKPQLNTSIVVGPNGVRTSTGVSVRQGPVSLGIRL